MSEMTTPEMILTLVCCFVFCAFAFDHTHYIARTILGLFGEPDALHIVSEAATDRFCGGDIPLIVGDPEMDRILATSLELRQASHLLLPTVCGDFDYILEMSIGLRTRLL
jgi:hypothetical protein